MIVEDYKSKIHDLNARKNLLEDKLAEEKKDAEEAIVLLETSQEAQKTIQIIAQTIQQQAHQKISEIVSKCLDAVFDDPYELKIDFQQKRGKTEAKLLLVRDGVELDDPLNASGGGVIDVAAFALRIACLCLTKPQKRRLIVLDEPFKFVSQEYRHRLVRMLKALSDDMKIQFLIVTHLDNFEIGKVVKIN